MMVGIGGSGVGFESLMNLLLHTGVQQNATINVKNVIHGGYVPGNARMSGHCFNGKKGDRFLTVRDSLGKIKKIP